MSKVGRATRALEETDNKEEKGQSAQAAKPTKGKGPEVKKDREGDVRIQNISIDNTVVLTRTIKVVLPPKFKGDLLKLK